MKYASFWHKIIILKTSDYKNTFYQQTFIGLPFFFNIKPRKQQYIVTYNYNNWITEIFIDNLCTFFNCLHLSFSVNFINLSLIVLITLWNDKIFYI